MVKTFYGAEDAARYATQFATQWVDEAGMQYDATQVISYMAAADSANPLDETNPEAFYLVNEKGDVGVTYTGGREVYWVYRGGYVDMRQQQNQNGYNGYKGIASNAYGAQPQYAQEVKNRLVGFSDKIHTREFAEAVRKNKRKKTGCAVMVTIFPLLLVPVYLHFSDDVDVVMSIEVGLCVSFLLSLFYLLPAIFLPKKIWVGEVTSKVQREDRHRKDYDSHHFREIHNIVRIRANNGRGYMIEEIDSLPQSHAYYYFKKGDKVRYLGGMKLRFPYEKYDKSHDDKIICVFCQHLVPIDQPYCKHCHKPLLN